MKISEALDKYMAQLVMIMTSRTGYTMLFKAFLSLVSLFLITNYTIFEMGLKLETESNRLKYVVEHELKKEIELNNFECVFEMKSYPECKLAKYNFKLSQHAIGLSKAVSHLLFYFMYITLGFSVLGFFSNPFYHNHKAIPYIIPPKT